MTIPVFEGLRPLPAAEAGAWRVTTARTVEELEALRPAWERVRHVTGYDPAYRDPRVGTYVLCRMLEHACADPDVELVD